MTRKPGTCSAAVLVAHGGGVAGTEAPHALSPAALRMMPFIVALRAHPAARSLLVTGLRYRVRGYNDGDPVNDVLWALDAISRDHGVPVVVLGHSMGARAALRAAGHPSVVAVAALSPWCPPDEPVRQLSGRRVMLVQGMSDRITAPEASLGYALRAREADPALCRFEVAGSGHAMIRRARLWHRLARDFTLGVLDLVPLDARIRDAFELPTNRAVAVAI